jgi:hypothetical protein
MALEMPKGVQSSEGMVVPMDSQRPKRKPKEPIPTKKERSERRQQCKVRLEEIDLERIKHNQALSKATPERVRLIKNLNDEKVRQKAQVDKVLDEHFATGTTGKLIDKVLQTEMVTPQMNQLQGSIDKLSNQIEWHRSKLKGLSNEEDGLNKELRKLDTADAAYAVYDQLQALFDTYAVFSHEYEKLRNLASEAEKLDTEWFSKVQAPTQFHAVVASSYLKRSMGKSSPSAFISHVQAIGGPYAPQNPFFTEYADRDTQQDRHIELRRPNFGDNRSVVR